MHEFCVENEHTNALTACARSCAACVVFLCRRWNGWGGESLLICCALHHSLVLHDEWWPLWCCSKAGVGGRQGEGSLSLCTHRIYFSHRTSYWREGTSGWSESEWERERVSVRVSPVCARGLHHRIPFTVSAGGHALMERIKSPTSHSFPSDSWETMAFQMWLTVVYVVCIEPCAVHLGETVTPWLWLWNL